MMIIASLFSQSGFALHFNSSSSAISFCIFIPSHNALHARFSSHNMIMIYDILSNNVFGDHNIFKSF